MTRRLNAEEFTEETWGSIAKAAIDRHSPWQVFDPKHFFSQIRHWIEQGVAIAWGADRAFLVGMFYRDLFTGDPVGVVLVWHSDRSKESVSLLKLFEAEARARECVTTSVGSHGLTRLDAVVRLYRQNGYVPYEMLYLKKLCQQQWPQYQ